MATLAVILGFKWPGNQWSFGRDPDNYAELQWLPGNRDPKPTEAEIRAFSDEIDAKLVEDEPLIRQQGWFELQNADHMLLSLEILMQVLMEMKRKLDDYDAKIRPTALSGSLTTLDPAVLQRAQNLRQRLLDARNR